MQLVCGALGALFVLGACSSGSGGEGSGTGNESDTGGGFGAGGISSNGGSVGSTGGSETGTGGGFVGSGGFPTSSGGFPTSSGGFPTSSGGDTSSTGGSETGTGGGETGTGGTTDSTGGTTGSTGGTTSTGGGTGVGGGPPAAGPCLTSATEGIIIGDSYVTGAGSPAMQPALAMLDPTATGFRNYAVPGTSLATGGILGLIPPQLTSAIQANPDIKFSIMDGGGNDALICDAAQFPNCATLCTSAGASMNTECQGIVSKALDAATTLMASAATAGIKDTIYFYYPHIPDAGSGGAGFAEILDYAEPKAKAVCDGAFAATGGKLSCFFVDLAAPFKAAGGDKNPANFAADGIHPSAAGQAIVSQQIFNVMKAQCIGFTAADAMKYGCTCTQ
jgi:lysophospholipase L1-like esterase